MNERFEVKPLEGQTQPVDLQVVAALPVNIQREPHLLLGKLHLKPLVLNLDPQSQACRIANRQAPKMEEVRQVTRAKHLQT